MTHTASVLHCILTTHTVEEHIENMTLLVYYTGKTNDTHHSQKTLKTRHTLLVYYTGNRRHTPAHTHTHTHMKKLFLDQMLTWPCSTFCENRVALVPVVMKI